jgi:hypothetical protein
MTKRTFMGAFKILRLEQVGSPRAFIANELIIGTYFQQK